MKFLAALSLLCCINASYALNILHRLGMVPIQHHSHSKSTAANQAFTDFTGTWNGVCTTDDGETYPTEIKILNSANAIDIYGAETSEWQSFPIGEYSIRTETTRQNIYTEHVQLSWDKDGKILTIYQETIMRRPTIHSYNSTGKFSLNGNQLIFSGSEADDSPNITTMNYKFTCNLNKIADQPKN